MLKYKIFSVFFILTTALLAAQQPPRTAVVPLNAVGVSENEAQVITGLFETALVQTESFHVIEQNQINEIMEAQAYSIGGCTDESCAIEVGKLLSAEQIILGDLSSIGGKIILNAKIIDVESGRNIKADKVDAGGMGEMTDAVELLAFKLAGLTYTSGGDVKVATTFGEVFIETNPPGADIYINGVKKGTSPDLINRIPLGQILVEAKKGNLYDSRTLTVSEDTAQIRLELEEQFGKLFIKSSEENVSVYFDGRKLADLGSGFFDGLPIGRHLLELKGEAVYWKGDVEIEPGVSTKVEAYPRGFGYIDYQLPDGASAYIKGPDFNRTVTGEGSLRLDEGIYRISVTGDIYIPFEKKVSIARGDRNDFLPRLSFTEAYLSEMAEKRRAEEYGQFKSELSVFDERFTDEHRYTESDISDLNRFKKVLDEAEFNFPDINERWAELFNLADTTKKEQDEMDELHRQKLELELQLSAAEDSQKGHRAGGWATLGIGSASAALSATSFILSWFTYQDYLTAGENEWRELKDRYKMWDLIGYISAGAAVAGGALTPVLWLTGPDDDDKAGLAASLAKVNSDISSLNGN